MLTPRIAPALTLLQAPGGRWLAAGLVLACDVTGDGATPRLAIERAVEAAFSGHRWSGAPAHERAALRTVSEGLAGFDAALSRARS